jgi:hypothetical protein
MTATPPNPRLERTGAQLARHARTVGAGRKEELKSRHEDSGRDERILEVAARLVASQSRANVECAGQRHKERDRNRHQSPPRRHA